jgi:phage FluMu protein Com
MSNKTNLLTSYFKNTSTFRCTECKYIFTLNFWQWLVTMIKVDFVKHRYVKCPRCAARHWLQAEKVL